MPTNTAGTSARQDPRQVVNTLKIQINYNDPGISTGIPFANYLPQGAFITEIISEVITAFNAATTNPISVGTVGPAYTNIVLATDITSGTPGVYLSTGAGARGRSLTAAGDVLPYVKYAPTGTAPTTGKAIIIIKYEGGWSN